MNKNSSLSSKQTKNENLKGSFGKKVRFALYSYFVHVAEFTDTLIIFTGLSPNPLR